MRCYLASRWRIQKTEETGLKQLEAAVTSLDQGGDRDALLQQHDSAFCLPFRFNYHPHEGDQVQSPSSSSSSSLSDDVTWYSIRSLAWFSVCLCIPGVRGECGEPGEVRARDQVPAASVPTRRRHFGNRGGLIVTLIPRIICVSVCSDPSLGRCYKQMTLS